MIVMLNAQVKHTEDEAKDYINKLCDNKKIGRAHV